MSAWMCLQSFVALRCVLRKPSGFLNPGELILTTRRRRTTRVAFGIRLPGPRISFQWRLNRKPPLGTPLYEPLCKWPCNKSYSISGVAKGAWVHVPRRSWNFFPSIIGLWAVRCNLWRSVALFSRIFSMCLQLLGASLRPPLELCPWIPLGTSDPPRLLLLSPSCSKFLATHLWSACALKWASGHWASRENKHVFRQSDEMTKIPRTSRTTTIAELYTHNFYWCRCYQLIICFSRGQVYKLSSLLKEVLLHFIIWCNMLNVHTCQKRRLWVVEE